MTKQQLYIFNCLYFVLTVAVGYLTRATPRRILGALAGAAVCGLAGIGILGFAEKIGWWHMTIAWEPYFLTLLWADFVLCAYVFLLTWRIARRFGGRGLVVLLLLGAVLGPLRDSWYMARFPEWGSYAPGIAPMLAISGSYVLLGILGHGTMRLVAGPAAADPLARRPWKLA